MVKMSTDIHVTASDFWLRYIYVGAWDSVVVKALLYGPGIDSWWCHWGFFPWLPPTEPWALGSIQPLKKNTRDLS